MTTPFFLTVDTEGDNLWERPKNITSINTEKLYRFQELCEKYQIKPIYLTNYEAAINKNYQKFIAKHKNNLEVGLHLHAWNSPPSYDLTDNDYKYHPYLHEYPNTLIVEKIKFMLDLLNKTFNCDIISHRGGRYSLNESIVDVLSNNGIIVDCSVTPGIDWSNNLGDPERTGGPNFKNSKRNIHTMYNKITEIPVSTFSINKYFDLLHPSNIIRRGIGKIFNYKNSMLRSRINNFKELQNVINWNLNNNATHLEYIIHSSELVSGHSPLLNSQEEEDLFYHNLEHLFIFLEKNQIKSMTFKEFMKHKESKREYKNSPT